MALSRVIFANMRTWGKEFVDVCGEQMTQESGREVMCISHKLVIGAKKSKDSRRRPRKKGKV
jgi:hypothetical protein